MNREIAKAINTLSKKLNDVARTLDNVLGSKCDENKESITVSEQNITNLDLQSLETEQAFTDIDLRITELEAKANE